jgi:hypothetical protein
VRITIEIESLIEPDDDEFFDKLKGTMPANEDQRSTDRLAELPYDTVRR